MVDKKTTQETTRSPIDLTELVRLATPGANWEVDLQAILNAFGSGAILRSSIPTTSMAGNTYVMTGTAAVGDYGAGATYTKVGATSGGPMAIQDANGTWFNLMPVNGIVEAAHFGAKGDGTNDDTTALQAAITYAFVNKYSQVHLRAGVYITSAELTVGTNNPGKANDTWRHGFTIYGDGFPYYNFGGGNSPHGGTSIYYTGASGCRSIICVFDDAYMAFRLQDIGMFCARIFADPDHPTKAEIAAASPVDAAILVNGTINGNHIYTNVMVGGATKGIYITPFDGGGNGEDFIFNNFWGYNVNYLYYNDDDASITNAQTYTHSFYNCGAQLWPGGAYFGHNGSGLAIFGFSATGMTEDRIMGNTGLLGNMCSNTTLFREVVQLNNCPIVIHGGRVESLTQLWRGVVNDWQTRSNIVIDGLQFIMDNRANGGTSGFTLNTVGSIIRIGNPSMLSIRDCIFDFQHQYSVGGTSLNMTLSDETGGFDFLVDFQRCDFHRPSAHPKSLAATWPGKVKFTECQYVDQTWPGAGFSDELDRFTAIKSRVTRWNKRDASSNMVLDGYVVDTDAQTVSANSTVTISEIRSTTAIQLGTRAYFEFDVVAGSSGNAVLGVANTAHALTNALGDSNGTSLAYSNDGSVTCNGSTLLAANGVTDIPAGSRGGMAINLDTMQVWVRDVTAVGNWNNSGTANPTTGVGGLSLAALKSYPFHIAAQLKVNAASVTMRPQGSSLTPISYINWNDIAFVPAP